MNYYQKQELVQRFVIWKRIPLFLVEDEEETKVVKHLPRCLYFNPADEKNEYNNQTTTATTTAAAAAATTKQEHPQKEISHALLSSSQKALVHKLLSSQIYENDVLVACLWLVTNNEHRDVLDRGDGLVIEQGEVDGDEDDIEYHSQGSSSSRLVWRAVVAAEDHHRDNTSIVSYESWKRLVRIVSRRILWIDSPHPLSHYATHEIPFLSEPKRRQVARALNNELWQKRRRGGNDDDDKDDGSSSSSLSSSSVCALKLMKQCQDRYPPRRFGVLLYKDIETTRYPHSCIPSAQLELVITTDDNNNDNNNNASNTKDSNQLQVVALYDISPTTDNADDDELLSLCYINGDDPVEQREEAVLRRTGHSCACRRCRYEVQQGVLLTATTGSRTLTPWLSTKQRIQLANYYLSKSRFDDAQKLYRQVVQEEEKDGIILSPHHHVADAWHALGAIELSKGRFLAAQRVWKDAAERFPEHCGRKSSHKGMALQLEKLHCYHYLEPNNNDLVAQLQAPITTTTQQASIHEWESRCIVKPNLAHVVTMTAPPPPHGSIMLSPSMCQQILDWASTLGHWTRQRHYAVPTFDVPVHTVEPLLEWFNSWFHCEIRPLLARQFGTSPNYFVHDAFCVKYQAAASSSTTCSSITGMSNHLPIHTDESTHSFIVALNDCDDYEGGGTYFYSNNDGDDQIVRLKVGQILSFRGDLLPHGGEAVTRNVRHILVAFLYHDDDDDNGKNNCNNNAGERKKKKRSRTESIMGQAHGSDAKNPNKEQKTSTMTGFTFGFQV